MKLFFQALILIFTPYLSANAEDVCSGTSYPYLTFPVSGQPGDITPKGGCFKGRSVVDYITGNKNASLTSALKLPDREIFYVTSYDPDKDKTKLTVVFQTAQGRVFERDLLTDSSYGQTPEKTFNGMRVVSFMPKRNLLVIETNAYAQSGGIHTLYVPPGNPLFENIAPLQKFVTAGNFVAIPLDEPSCPECMLISTIEHDSQGAFFPTKLVSLDGKEFCQVDTREDSYKLSPVCLKTGQVFKPR